MSLSEAQIGLLGNPFKLEEHGFKNGNVFIRKSAIRARLDKVDPGWQLTPPELVTVNGDVVVMRGGLTIAGVTRYDIGTGIIQRVKKDPKDASKHIALSDFDVAENTVRAFKSAVTGILARAVIQFGCGEYLKDMNEQDKATVKNAAALEIFLKKLPVYVAPPPPLPVQPPLAEADYQALHALTQKHLNLSLDGALANLELPKWDDFRRAYPNLDGARKAIGSALADKGWKVIVHQAETLRAKNDALYLSLDFGFATVPVFDRDIPDVFSTTAMIADWQKPGYTRTFDPPLLVILRRDSKGYPKASFAEQMDDDSLTVAEPEGVGEKATNPLS